MNTLKSLCFLLVFSLPLCAQKHQLNEDQLGAYKGREDAVHAVMNYCDASDDFSREGAQPRLFTQLKSGSTKEAASQQWWEFASKAEWYAAGKPAPLAFVWDRDGAIVRVTIVARPPRGGASLAFRRTDYCYGPDTKLIRIRAVWYAPTDCELLFPCRLISGREFLLGGQHPGVTDWVFTPDRAIQKLRNGEAVDDYFDPSYSLTASDLQLRTSKDLPFGHPATPSTLK